MFYRIIKPKPIVTKFSDIIKCGEDTKFNRGVLSCNSMTVGNMYILSIQPDDSYSSGDQTGRVTCAGLSFLKFQFH